MTQINADFKLLIINNLKSALFLFISVNPRYPCHLRSFKTAPLICLIRVIRVLRHFVFRFNINQFHPNPNRKRVNRTEFKFFNIREFVFKNVLHKNITSVNGNFA